MTEYAYKPERAESVRALIARINAGERIAVEIVDDSCFAGCDGYLENGMRAVITSAVLNESASDGVDEVYLFTLNFSDFVEFNSRKETSAYQTNEGLLTATQARVVPENYTDVTYFSITHSDLFFRELSSLQSIA